MKRWVGLGVIADNLINIARAIARVDLLPGLITAPIIAPESS